MTNPTLERARAGDEDAFRELTDPYRRELQVHIYRIVGSVHDAEDLLQETLLAAWRGPGAVRGTGVGPCLAVPDRDQPFSRCAPRDPAPPGRPAADDRDARAHPPRRGDLARALPRRSARGHSGPGSRPGGSLRDQRGDRAGVHRRPAASVPAAARGAGAPRRARLPRGGGRRDARDHRTLGQQPAAPRPRGIRDRGCPPPDANGRRSPTPNASATPSAASPTRSK